MSNRGVNLFTYHRAYLFPLIFSKTFTLVGHKNILQETSPWHNQRCSVIINNHTLIIFLNFTGTFALYHIIYSRLKTISYRCLPFNHLDILKYTWFKSSLCWVNKFWSSLHYLCSIFKCTPANFIENRVSFLVNVLHISSQYIQWSIICLK